VSAPDHDVITGQLTISVRLAEPVVSPGPKLLTTGKRPEIAAERATLLYAIDSAGTWRAMEMAALGLPVDPEVGTSTLRRAWDRSSVDQPPSWLAELARLHRPG